jgi:hypothetical protein
MEKNYSRLLINDQVLPNAGTEVHPAVLDFTMLTYFNARERTESQWRVLLGKAGVEVVRIWRLGSGSEAVIEGMRSE